MPPPDGSDPFAALLRDAADAPHLLARGDAHELIARVPAAAVDLVYADPPFGTGAPRIGRDGSRYDDATPEGIEGHVEWLRALAAGCRRVLRPTGSLFLHLDWRVSHRARVVLDEVFGAPQFRNEIVWHYGLGGAAPRDAFARKHDTILFYARSGEARFTAERGAVTPAMAAKYAHVDEDGRRYQNAHGRRYYLRGGKRHDDVWEIPALAPTARERVGWPTQKPLALLERIVRAVTGEGDLVLDPCCGSGTTLVAAASLGRRAVGFDREPAALALAEGRLRATAYPVQPRDVRVIT